MLQLIDKDSILSARPFGPLTPTTDGRFRTAGGDELRFSGSEALTVYRETGRDRFRRVAPAASPITLNSYFGRYASQDADATYRVTPQQGEIRLTLESRPQAGFTVRPIGTDLLLDAEEGTVVRFHRDQHGNVDGLSITTSRAFAMPFVKVPEGAIRAALPNEAR